MPIPAAHRRAAAPPDPHAVRRHADRARSGLTLAELLVAVCVLGIGVLAAAGVTLRLLQAASAAARAATATRLLDARAESLWVAPCAAAAGEREVESVRERWSVRDSGSLLVLADTVRHTLPGRPPQLAALRALRWCAP